MGVIYKITNPSDKVYVGKTYDLRKRINCHKCSAKKGKNIHLHNSIRKYGWDAHFLEIIEEVEDSMLDEREVFWIKELKSYYRDSPMGMNMTLGGEGQRNTWMDDLERRKRASIYFTENPKFKGRKHTEENKKIIAEKASKRNREKGITIPKWGAEKGRLKVIKACIAYDSSGNFIGEYESLTDCAKKLLISRDRVTNSCIKQAWINGSYLVKYKTNDSYEKKITVGNIKLQTCKRAVIYIDKQNKQKEYPSSLEASNDLGIPKTTINRAANYNKGRPIRTGHRFIYKDLLDTIKLS